MHDALIRSARKLASTMGRGSPNQSDLRRAISTAYYALFHAISHLNADRLVGTGAARSTDAWVRTYRALDHGPAKTACEAIVRLGTPSHIAECAEAFVVLQVARHQADYDPAFRTSASEVEALIQLAEAAIGSLAAAGRQEQLDFAVELLLRRRGR